METDPRALEVVTRVSADTIDERDLIYERRTGEGPIRPAQIGCEEYQRNVRETWHQRGQECTGFALAAIANYLNRKQLGDPDAPSVSRRMFYEMARRYDGNTGTGWEETSTLRGALKGWSRTGAARDDLWPYHPHDEDGSVHGTLTLARLLDARTSPLGSYRKVLDGDVDTMAEALAEGHVLFVSARLHAGWYRLFLRDDEQRPVIARLPGDEVLGGHAFVIVGYDDTSGCFWVHNSWGPEWGVEGYALLPYAEWEAQGQDAWVVDLQPPLDRESEAPQTAPSAETRTVSYRDMWPHLVVLRDDGKLAADGLYEMDRGTVGTLLYLFQEATIGWSRRRLAIVVDGGYLPIAETIVRQRALRDRLMAEDTYPIFVDWETSWWSDLEAELGDWLERLVGPSDRRGEMDVSEPGVRSAIDRSVAGLIWYEIMRRSALACAPGGGGALLAEAITTKRHQGPTARRGPFDLHLVSHGVGDLLATEFVNLLPPLVSTVSALAPATTVPTFGRAYGGALDRNQLGQLTVVMLDAAAEDADCVGRVNQSFLRLITELRIDPGEAAPPLQRSVGQVMGIMDRTGVDERLAVHGSTPGRLAHAYVSNSSHVDLVWDVNVHNFLIETIRRQR